jgi:hypothetical protein
MTREQAHNTPGVAHNTPREEEDNTQPEQEHKQPAKTHTLQVPDTLVAPDMFPGGRPAAAVRLRLQKQHWHWPKLLWIEVQRTFSLFTSLLKVNPHYFIEQYYKSCASHLFNANYAN